MSFLARLIFHLFANAIALYVVRMYVAGVTITGGLVNIVTIAAVLTLLNMFIRPILKIILSPIIILTLGLGIIIVNAAMLALLDFLSPSITIEGLVPLLYATLIVSVINFFITFVARHGFE